MSYVVNGNPNIRYVLYIKKNVTSTFGYKL